MVSDLGIRNVLEKIRSDTGPFLTSAYPVFALSNNKLVYLSDKELNRIPRASTRIPKMARVFDTKRRDSALHDTAEMP